MNLRLTFYLLTFSGATALASGSKLAIHPRFLSPSQTTALKETDLNVVGTDRRFGQALLDQETVLHLPRNHSVPVKTTEEGEIPIMVTVLTESSPRHVDVHMDQDCGYAFIQDEVAFVFLNTNENATFVHGDTQVAVESGTLVVFQAGIEHNTVIHSGQVHLAGPFHLDSVDSVGFFGTDGGDDEHPNGGGDRRQLKKMEAVKRANGKLRGLQKQERILETSKEST